jgi:hypothetical protein
MGSNLIGKIATIGGIQVASAVGLCEKKNKQNLTRLMEKSL